MDTIELTRPGQSTKRDRLREIIAVLAEETHRLNGLTEARDRARAELAEANRDHQEQLQHLDKVRHDDPIEAAYRYANRDLIGLVPPAVFGTPD